MDPITITETYHPGDTFYACPLNNEYLKAKQQAGVDVTFIGATSDGLQNDGSFVHQSTWAPRAA